MAYISRFMCQNYLFNNDPIAATHCEIQCEACKPESKVMKENEEKEPMWFVWEAVQRGTGLFYQPALYRGMPQTGTGEKADNARFVFKKKIEGDDISKEFVTLINENPCPVKRDEKSV